jgi:hypothetical protein
MNIDLLFTREGEAGLITSENLVQKAIGAVFDTQSGIISLEFADMDYMEMNIPVEPEFFDRLDQCGQIHLGAIKNGHIAQAYQIPFMFLDDPYRAEAFKNMRHPQNPLNAFNNFVKSCASGQPVHRADLGDENAMGCILGESSPASLQFAPHLARRYAMEVKPVAAPAPRGPGPSAPGLGSPGLGGSISGGTVHRSPPQKPIDPDE